MLMTPYLAPLKIRLKSIQLSSGASSFGNKGILQLVAQGDTTIGVGLGLSRRTIIVVTRLWLLGLLKSLPRLMVMFRMTLTMSGTIKTTISTTVIVMMILMITPIES